MILKLLLSTCIFVSSISLVLAQERTAIVPFMATNSAGESVSITDFKGKVIYLDIWATWCLPCRILFPKSQKVEKQYKNKDIVFMYVSVDKEKSKWDKFIARKEPEGVQLIANDDFINDFMPIYNIYGIPRFMLIDKQGKVYSADASRPGWPELIDEIDLLLKE